MNNLNLRHEPIIVYDDTGQIIKKHVEIKFHNNSYTCTDITDTHAQHTKDLKRIEFICIEHLLTNLANIHLNNFLHTPVPSSVCTYIFTTYCTFCIHLFLFLCAVTYVLHIAHFDTIT